MLQHQPFLGHWSRRKALSILFVQSKLGGIMDCLWITLADPDPATNGQLIYSQGLIRAARGAGASLCVVGLSRREKLDRPLDAVGLAWQLGEERSWPRWRRTLRSLPEIAQRGVS